MNTTSTEKLGHKKLTRLLEDIYRSIPEIMPIIAPDGWKNTKYHLAMMEDREEIYRRFTDSDTVPANYPRLYGDETDLETGYDTGNTNDFELYFSVTFPPLYDDDLEVFYLFTDLLAETINGSLLYRNTDQQRYYIEEEDVYDLMLAIPHRHGHIDKWVYTSRTVLCGVPLLDDMDLIHCLQFLFGILRQTGYFLLHRDHELLYIRELQISYEELLYAPISPKQRTDSRQQTREHIDNCVSQYTDSSAVDIFNFYEIVALFNSKKVSCVVLAYLHVYHELPKGYPFTPTDYDQDMDGEE